MQTELIFTNANVLTLDAARPGAAVVAVGRGRILAVGGNDALPQFERPGVKIIDCAGKTLVPGFIDAHCHFFSLVRRLLNIDLSPPLVKSIDDIKNILRQKAGLTPPGQWLVGTDYNDFYLAEKRHPTRHDIDEVVPDKPVILCHRSLHACVLNSRALALAGITNETPEPPGALIERDLETGEPNGVVYEMLGHIREKVIPPVAETELERGVSLANAQYLANGITSIHEATAVNSLGQWKRLRELVLAGKLKSRIYFMPGIKALEEFTGAGLPFRWGDNRLRVGAVKLMPNEATGQLYPPQPELNAQVLAAHRAGYQVAIHAVSSRLVEAAVTALEYARDSLPEPDKRHRIEHCSVCPPPLVARLREAGALVVTQPPFVYYSGDRYLATVCRPELPWLYRFRALLEAGIMVAGSSDSPIVPNSPLMGIHAAVNRRTESGQPLLPAESIPAYRALQMYTSNAAYASFDEETKGTIAPGKLADLVLLSDDPLNVEPEAVKDIKVLMTVIGGEVAWQS